MDGDAAQLMSIHLHMKVNVGALDVLWGQPIKPIQVASNSEFCKKQWNDLLPFPLIALGPQKPKKLKQ